MPPECTDLQGLVDLFGRHVALDPKAAFNASPLSPGAAPPSAKPSAGLQVAARYIYQTDGLSMEDWVDMMQHSQAEVCSIVALRCRSGAQCVAVLHDTLVRAGAGGCQARNLEGCALWRYPCTRPSQCIRLSPTLLLSGGVPDFGSSFVTMLWQCVAILESLSYACFVCVMAVISAYGTSSFGDFKWRNFLRAKLSLAKLSPGEILPAPL